MNTVEALKLTIEYLRNRELKFGERHPIINQLVDHLEEEQALAGLENKTKAELIALIRTSKTYRPSIIRVTDTGGNAIEEVVEND